MSARSNYTRKQYPETTAAYMAGILDGEGSLTIGNYSCSKKTGDKHYQVNIAVCSTDEILIDWIYDTFGGFKGTYTPKQMSRNGRKQVYRWQCSSDRLLHICEICLPYLTIKKKQAEILIKMRHSYIGLQNVKGRRNNQRIPKEVLDFRQSLFEKLKLLHGRTYSYKNDK